MASFYPGQPVRYVGAGTVAIKGGYRLTKHGDTGAFIQYWQVGNMPVAIVAMAHGPTLACPPDEIEPILLAGLESIDEINALYEPTPEVAHS